MQSHVCSHAYSTGFGTCPAQFFDESMVLRDKAIGEVKITMNKVRGTWVPGVGYVLSVSWQRKLLPMRRSCLAARKTDACHVTVIGAFLCADSASEWQHRA